MKNYKYNHSLLKRDYLRGMSYPDLHKKYGICTFHAGEIMRAAGISRSSSESLLFKTGGWRKLVSMEKASSGKTRILSLPAEIIKKLGFNPNNYLEGKWQIFSKTLTLEIRESKKAEGSK